MPLIKEYHKGEDVIMFVREHEGATYFEAHVWIQHFVYNAIIKYGFHADRVANELNRRHGYAVEKYTGQMVSRLAQHIEGRRSVQQATAWENRHWAIVTKRLGPAPGKETATRPQDLAQSAYKKPGNPPGTVPGYVSDNPYEAQPHPVYRDGRAYGEPSNTSGSGR